VTNAQTQNIFESPSQRLEGVDPATIRLIEDRVLIRDLGDVEKVGSIIIPETARGDSAVGSPRLRLGLVIAVGPGDKFVEKGFDEHTGQVLRVAVTVACSCGMLERLGKACGVEIQKYNPRKWFDIRKYEFVELGPGEACPLCHDTGRAPVTVPPQCQPGDKVLYDRRREAEHRYVLCHAEQAVFAVVED
jgi:co-chaperonin GroES (HSP10)